MSFAGFIAAVMGMFNFGDNTIALVSFVFMELACIITYVLIEGKLDAATIATDIGTIAQQVFDMIVEITDGDDEAVVIPDDDDRVSTDILDKLDK